MTHSLGLDLAPVLDVDVFWPEAEMAAIESEGEIEYKELESLSIVLSKSP